MLRTRLIIYSGTVSEYRAPRGQRLFEVGSIKTRVAGEVQVNPAESFAFADGQGIRIAESDFGILQSRARFTIFAAVIIFKKLYRVITDTLNQQFAFSLMGRPKIVVAPNCKSSIIHRLFLSLRL